MGHFANQLWKTPSGLAAEYSSLLEPSWRPFDTHMGTPFYPVKICAPRDCFVKVTYFLYLGPDSNTAQNATGSTTVDLIWTNPAGTTTTTNILTLDNDSATSGINSDGVYPVMGYKILYVKAGTNISFKLANEDLSMLPEWDKDGLFRGYISMEYDR